MFFLFEKFLKNVILLIIIQCHPGFASCSACEEVMCLDDTDSDGIADYSINCTNSDGTKVRFSYLISLI